MKLESQPLKTFLAIGLRYNFAPIQSLLMVPSILAILIFKLYTHCVYLRSFRFFIPRAEEFASIASYSENADVMSNKLLRRFGHPALHAELFTPLLHQKMMPLLKEVYSGRISENEDEKPFIPSQTPCGRGFSRGVGSDTVYVYADVPRSPAGAPTSPGRLSLEVVTEVLYDVLFRGVNQVMYILVLPIIIV